MKASIYYKVIGFAAALATLSAFAFDRHWIGSGVSGSVAVAAALIALAAYIVNYINTYPALLDSASESMAQLLEISRPAVPRLFLSHSAPLSTEFHHNPNDKIPTLFVFGEPTGFRSEYHTAKDYRLISKYNYFTLRDRFSHIISANEPDTFYSSFKMTLAGFGRSASSAHQDVQIQLLFRSIEDNDLLARMEKLERQIERLAQERLKQAIRNIANTAGAERPEMPTARPARGRHRLLASHQKMIVH